MSITFLIVLTLTAAVTIFAVLASILLVIHKGAAGRKAGRMKSFQTSYARLITEYLTADLPDVQSGSPARRKFKALDELLVPIRTKLASAGVRNRSGHLTSLTLVVLDFSRDLSGESIDRLVYLSYALGLVDNLLRELGDRRWWVRAEAAKDLGTLRARRAIAPLTAAVEDQHPDVRFQAIKALLTLVGVDALRSVFRVGHDLSVWNSMELSIDVLRFREEAVPFLVEGLASTDQTIVQFCIELLAEIGFVDAVNPLIETATTYPNVTVRAKAIEALGRLGDERAVRTLVMHINNPQPILRISSLRALARIGVPTAVSALKQRLLEGPFQEKIAAARALVRAGDEGIATLQDVRVRGGVIQGAAEQALEEGHLSAGGPR